MLPIVRPYEYLMIQALFFHAGRCELETVRHHAETNVKLFRQESFDHALQYMMRTGFFDLTDGILSLQGVRIGVEFDEYMNDLLEYGLGKYDVDFDDADPDQPFHLWAKYRKEQIQQEKCADKGEKQQGLDPFCAIAQIRRTSLKAEIEEGVVGRVHEVSGRKHQDRRDHHGRQPGLGLAREPVLCNAIDQDGFQDYRDKCRNKNNTRK